SEAARDVVEEILVRGQRAGQSRTALECGDREVAWLGIKPNRVLTIGVAVIAVTAGAIAAVVRLRVRSMPGDIPDVALHRLDHDRWLRPYVRNILSGCSNRQPGHANQADQHRQQSRIDTTHWLQTVHSQHPST